MELIENKEQFYRAVDKLLGVDTYTENLPYRKRWGQRKSGNGRYEGFGIVRFFGMKNIHVALRNPPTNVTFRHYYNALKYIEQAVKTIRERDMKKFLLTFERSWADEFKVYGFKIASEEEKLEIESYVRERGNEGIEIYFGTNEGWNGSLRDLASGIKFIAISENEVAVLERLFPNLKSPHSFMRHFGYVPDIVEYFLEKDLEDLEESEED